MTMIRRVWSSKITYDMVRHLPEDVRENLYDELDIAVESICGEYELRG